MVVFAASVLVTVLAWRAGAPWLVAGLCLACQAILLARRVVLFYGPWIMGVDELRDLQFFGEPWDENVVYLPAEVGVPGAALTHAGIHKPNHEIACGYRHGGFHDLEKTVLTPMGQVTLHPGQTTFAARLRYQRPPQ